MLRKILSDGGTGAGRAALDVACALRLNCGGWYAADGKDDASRSAACYGLRPLRDGAPSAAVDRCVTAADGTLIVTFGPLPPLTRHALRESRRHERHSLGIDLQQHPLFEAAARVCAWIDSQRLATLYVTGNTQGQAPRIYVQTARLLHGALTLGILKPELQRRQVVATDPAYRRAKPEWPPSLAAAVDQLLATLPLKERSRIAHLASAELDGLHFTLGRYVREAFGLLTGNRQLLEDCQAAGGLPYIVADEASAVIIRELWLKLRATHRLRVIP